MKKLEKLLSSENVNESIIELDDYISEFCQYGEDLNILTELQKQFYFNQCLEREINNGGFSQYFYNSSGVYSHETVLSLQAIGAFKTADIMQKAIDQFPDKTVPKDSDELEDMVEEIEDETGEVWEELDEKFVDYEDDLNALNIEFVRLNKDFF